MASITLKDTGYVNSKEEGSQLTGTTEIVNEGVAVEVKGVSLRYQRGVGIDDSPVPGKYDESQLNFVSVNNPVITLNGVVKRTNAVDMNKLRFLDLFCKTKGVKVLYYGSESDNWSDLIDSVGTKDNYTSHYSGTHAHVRCSGLTANQDPNTNHIRFTLTCKVTD